MGGFDLALRKYGTRKYPELLAEAIETARDGHPLTPLVRRQSQRIDLETESVSILRKERC